MNAPELTSAQESCLRNQVIDPLHPGALLHDFAVMLDYVGSHDLKAAGKHNLLPISVLGELDERLHQPLRLFENMKRPQLRSHPYLQGLYLLLRTTGLGMIEGAGDKARLKIDRAVLAQWETFNPTERYCTLLEAWLRLGRPESIGEQGSSYGTVLSACLMLWMYFPPRGQRTEAQQESDFWVLGRGRELYQLALMDLFGLAQVIHPAQPVKPWCPASANRLPFGEALFTLLEPYRWGKLPGEDAASEDEEDNEEAAEHDFGAWQAVLQPYFPQWQRTLKLEPPPTREGVFIFKVSLGKIWRRVAIAAEATLDDLAWCIVNSVEFSDDHLYQFTVRDRFGGAFFAEDPRREDGFGADELGIGDLPLEPGQTMDFLYDFGDNWQFKVLLERIEPPGVKIKTPAVVERHGKSPEQYPDSDW
jgi:hypothetical protein